MALERTFSIVKPDAVARDLIGAIYSRFEGNGLRIIAARMVHLTTEQAKGFYAEHEGKGFFDDLVGYMTSGPVMIQVLEGEGAIAKNRKGIRYPELLAFIGAATEQRLADIETRLTALENA